MLTTFKDADIWLDWAKSYYEEQAESIQIDSVQKVYRRENITCSLIKRINPKRNIEFAIKELKEIGYKNIF